MCVADLESQSSCAEPANGTRSDFDGPDSFFVDSKLRVNGPVNEAERARCFLRALLNLALRRFWKPGRCDVDRLFEKGAFERIGLVKNCKNSQSAVGEESLESHFPARDVAFH